MQTERTTPVRGATRQEHNEGKNTTQAAPHTSTESMHEREKNVVRFCVPCNTDSLFVFHRSFLCSLGKRVPCLTARTPGQDLCRYTGSVSAVADRQRSFHGRSSLCALSAKNGTSSTCWKVKGIQECAPVAGIRAPRGALPHAVSPGAAARRWRVTPYR